MPISLDASMMRSIIMDHYENPVYKREPKDDSYISIHMDSASCVDDIMVYLKVEDNKVIDCCFTGVACTISTASTDIMCGLMIGKTLIEAKNILNQYMNMIKEKEYDAEVLDEAIVFMNTSKQAARIKCATIGWDGLDSLIGECEHKHER